MSMDINAFTDGGTPTYLAGADPTRRVTDFASHTTAASDYFPVWLKCLADDVTIEGSMMNGAVQGADAVRAIVAAIRSLYEHQVFNFAGPYGDNGFLEDYNARVQGQPIGNVVLVTRNSAGQAQHIAANYRPRESLLLLSRLVGEHFAGSPIGEHFATGAD